MPSVTPNTPLENTITVSDATIDLPDACPWGVAVYADFGQQMLKANAHLRTHYFDSIQHATSIEEQFRFRCEDGWNGVLRVLKAGSTWTGRVVPLANQHGVSSVEIAIHSDKSFDGRLWLYTLEHPTVNGEMRFSSRSEIKILQTLLDNTLEYIFLRDTEGRFMMTNRAFRTAAAMDNRTSPTGVSMEAYVSKESADWIRENDKEVVSSGSPSVNKVTHFSFKNGKSLWLQVTTVPVLSSDGILIGSVSVARDISDLKRTESDLLFAIKEAKAASRAKGEFLAAMSHEIRTPINGVIGASELCLETELDHYQRDYLETVVQCSNTLMSLVNDVLDFSKIEAGQLSLEKLNFCPITLIEDVAAEFSLLARKKNLELMASYDQKLPRYVLGDPTRMKQVLYNLVSNAIKFTESGQVIIRAETVESSEFYARIRFSVTDTGIGIEPSRCSAIFNSFTQADMSTTRKYGGTGLGLSISKELAELMGGEIDVVSKVGEGALFSVEIPFECTPNHGADAVSNNPALAGLRVLIVDDNQTNREIYAQMCEGWGYRSTVAESGMSALLILESALKEDDPIQLILLDHQMPGLSGLDFVRLLDGRSELSDCRVLLLSSSMNREDAEEAAAIGVARSLTKPVRRSTLLEVILETFDVAASDVFDGEGHSTKAGLMVSGASLRILLAEDNKVSQNLASRRLEKMGHTVQVAESGTSVLQLFKEQTFDCIFMDIQMPDMDGFQTTKRIRTIEAETNASAVFIVAMTAHAMNGDRERCIKSGMNEYISKPFRVEEMRAVLACASGQKAVGASNPKSQISNQPKRLNFLEGLEALDEEDRSDVLSVATIFAETLPDEINRFERALTSRDCKQIRFVAHSLKGVCSIFLYEPCISLARKVEEACYRDSIEEVDIYSTDLIAELKTLAEEIKATL
ncbi:MAG: response regulator [Opitutaceae bacterium]